MTTCEYLLFLITGVVPDTIEYLFGNMSDGDDYLKQGLDACDFLDKYPSASNIWWEAIWAALLDIFNSNKFNVIYNASDSCIELDRKYISRIHDFEKKHEIFKKKTGFEIRIVN